MTISQDVVAGSSVPEVLEERLAKAGRIQVPVLPPLESGAGVEAIAIEDGSVGLVMIDSLTRSAGVEVGVVVSVPWPG